MSNTKSLKSPYESFAFERSLKSGPTERPRMRLAGWESADISVKLRRANVNHSLGRIAPLQMRFLQWLQAEQVSIVVGAMVGVIIVLVISLFASLGKHRTAQAPGAFAPPVTAAAGTRPSR